MNLPPIVEALKILENSIAYAKKHRLMLTSPILRAAEVVIDNLQCLVSCLFAAVDLVAMVEAEGDNKDLIKKQVLVFKALALKARIHQLEPYVGVEGPKS